MRKEPCARVVTRALLYAGVAIGPACAQAATTGATFNVTATVVASCTVSASNVAFGNYGAAQTDATGTLSATCTNLTAYTVGLDAGTGSGASVSSRKMTGPSSQTLDYTLYQDTTRLVVWGNTVGVDTVAGVGNGGTQTITVSGRVPAAQYPGAGSYSDTVTVTVTY